MLQTTIITPDGTEIGTGTGKPTTVKSYKLTSCVNDGTELAIGSTCADALEVTVFDIGAKLNLTAGDEVTVYRGENGARKKVGVFVLDKPTRPSANTMKLTGYDRIVKLDKDLTEWVKGLTGWPYTLKNFAKMVCAECGLTLIDSDIPNANFPVYQFLQAGATGRKIMKWLGEICARFCRATPDGKIEFAWYSESGATISATGERFYYQGALSYEAYQVAYIDAVQVRLADSTNGALWPEKDGAQNPYIIANNAVLNARITEALLPYLEVIEGELAGITYTPCKAAIPACTDIEAGSIVDVIDRNGKQFSTYVMSKVTSGQKDTIECTGSANRGNATSNNQLTSAELMTKMQGYSDNAAKKAVDTQTQKDIFDKLTNYGELQGLFYQNGKWYVNFEYVQAQNLVAGLIQAGILKSKDGHTYFDLDNAKIVCNLADGSSVIIANGQVQLTDTNGKVRATIEKKAGMNTEYGFRLYNVDGKLVGGISTYDDYLMVHAPREDGGGTIGFSAGWRTINGVTYLTAL